MNRLAETGLADRPALDAIGRVLASISRGPFELQPTLDQIAREARELCNADAAFCFLRDGDVFRFAAADGGTPEHWAYEREHPDPIDDRSIVGRVGLAGAPVQIPDIAEDPAYRSVALTIGGFRTLLGVPIGPADDLVGAFGIARTQVSPFSEEAIALVTLFADQAAVAIRIARLLGAEHQAQDRERSLDAVLASIARAQFDVEKVLEAVIAESARLCGADTGNIAVRNGDAFWIRAVAGFSVDYEALVRQHRYEPTRGSVIGRVLLAGTVVQIPDVLADREYELLDLQRLGKFRSAIGVPIWQDGEITGVIATARNEVRPFGDREVGILKAFADQVAIALRLVGLLSDMNEALARESAVADVLASIARSRFELHSVLNAVTETAARLTRADSGNLALIDGGVYRIGAAFGERSEELRRTFEESTITLDRGSMAGRVTLERRAIQIPDVLADPEYTQLHMQKVVGFRTLLGVPLLRDGNVTGVLMMQRTTVRPFTDQEIALITTFADQAALAIANIELYETVERQRASLARFAPHVAGLLESPEGETLLAGHRREISALFSDMRGFTAFAETAEPEELFSVLCDYHAAVGEIVAAHGGVVEHFAGDGFMIFFNDPTPVPDHPLAAIRTALAMRDRFAELAAGWRKRGHDLGLGIGISVGYATLGRIGFEGRYDYAGVGAVTNLAARLSSAAAAGEILVSQRMHGMVEDVVTSEPAGDLELKGFSHPVPAFRVTGLRAQHEE
jgi:class 3 adenylate cyclase